MKLRKIIAAAAALSLAVGVFAGCGGKDDTTTADGAQKIQIWSEGDPVPTEYKTEYDMPGQKYMAQQLKEKFNVEVEYIHPTAGQESTQFNLLLASRKLPDAITYWWYQIPGGVEKAINDGYIYAMDEEFLKTNAPNFYKLLQENPIYDKACKTESGKYFVFPKLFDYKEGQDGPLYTNGFVMRADWLKELNLEIPETIDEWHTALTAFKEKKGATAAFTGTSFKSGFEGGFGIRTGFYHDGDVVKYGEYEDAYKDYLTTLNQWYKEGLIDTNMSNMDSKQVDARILNGEAGATYCWLGSGMGKWLANTAVEEGFDLIGVPFPVKNKGEKSKYTTVNYPVAGVGTIITGQAKNPELVAKVLDYAYSDEGHMLANFGIEGESYNMEDGYPKYTDVITNNPDKAMVDVLKEYCASTTGHTGTYREDYRYIEQYYAKDQLHRTQEIWKDSDGLESVMPNLSYTDEESTEQSKILSEVKTYVDEMTLKFIMGVEPVENFDEYKAQLKALGIERAIEIAQSAYTRYMNK